MFKKALFGEQILVLALCNYIKVLHLFYFSEAGHSKGTVTYKVGC